MTATSPAEPTPTVPSIAWELPIGLDAFATLEPEVAAFLTEHGVERRAGYATRLVIEEIVRNLVEHGEATDTDQGAFTVRLDVEESVVHVVIEDQLVPFDPEDAPALDTKAPLEERDHRGMGLHLVRTMTDDLAYARIGGRNRLTATIARE